MSTLMYSLTGALYLLVPLRSGWPFALTAAQASGKIPVPEMTGTTTRAERRFIFKSRWFLRAFRMGLV